MTPVTRPVVRETAARVFSGGSFPVVIEIVPPGHLIRLRLKGRRKAVYSLSVEWLYQEAVRQAVARQRDENRKAKRSER